MSRFVTLKKSDTKFGEYIWGTFSKTEIALPVQSLNVQTADEQVTFEILQKNLILKPSPMRLFLKSIKIKNFILILIPAFYIFAKQTVDNQLHDHVSFFLACIALVFLFAGFNILNEVNDHVSGYDRVNQTYFDKPLQLGWTTAWQEKRKFWWLTAVSLLFALPVFFLQKSLLIVVLLTALLMKLGRFLSANSYKDQTWSELILGFVSGPALIAGLQLSTGSPLNSETLFFGFMWGWAILFLVHLNNFSYLLTSSQAQIKNTMTRLGFDRAKIFIVWWWGLFVLLWTIYHKLYASTYWSWFTTVTLVFWCIPTEIKISKINSPVGSDLKNVRKTGHRNFMLMSILILIEFGWYLITKDSLM